MSIRVMTILWDLCIYQGGMLTTLLAMADFGDDEGYDIFPKIDLLAAKTRMSERNVRGCLSALRDDGVLVVLDDEGNDLPRGTTPVGGKGRATPQYRIDLDRLKTLQANHRECDPGCAWCLARDRRRKRVATKAAKSDAIGGKNAHRTIEEPLGTVIDPSAVAGGDAGKAKTTTRKVIGDWRPGPDEFKAADEYWAKRGRGDLLRDAADIAEHFVAHHASRGSRMADWPKAWQTWYVNQVTMRRPDANARQVPRLATAEGTTIDQWVYRLTAWFIGHPDDDVTGEVAKGYWHQTWGPNPRDRNACKAPAEAWAAFTKKTGWKAA